MDGMIRIVYVLDAWREGAMQKKLTITIDERVYRGLHRVVGRGKISRFIENLVRPYVVEQDLDAAYREMAQDEEREAKALEWAEATIGDVGDEAR
jgi:hypothetical protein